MNTFTLVTPKLLFLSAEAPFLAQQKISKNSLEN